MAALGVIAYGEPATVAVATDPSLVNVTPVISPVTGPKPETIPVTVNAEVPIAPKVTTSP